ncbi:MAG TPA: response regulator transcription factor [Bacteroidia bacterium]|jgi:DNA-binding response OmpR family regulator|nr:response regulator transcription factor [Bacteroidia bacterium]
MAGAHILVIEDDRRVASFIRKGLEEDGFQVDVAYDGIIGKKMALASPYELIILDINLPQINGYEVCKQIRNHNGSIPIIMLTALGTMEDKLEGFDSGTDDYLVKPFEFKELLARVRVFLKRSGSAMQSNNMLKLADLEMDLNAKTVSRSGKQIELTAKEFQLLEFFLRNKNKVVSRAEIAEKVWEITFDSGTNIIDVYVSFLRNKIDKNYSPKLIHTLVGMGYIIKEA